MRDKLRELFSIDLRALVFFRICVAVILMIDLILSAGNLTAFYTDAGFLPRHAIYSKELMQQYLWISPYYFSGSAWWIATLFILNGICAFALLIGYHTRAATCLCWLFLVALHDRNNLILHGGDILLRFLLLWAIFLPWGAKFSIDHLRSPPETKIPKTIFSIATISYLVQICLVYWSSVAFKWNQEWLEGNAVYYALSINQFATPFGLWVLQHKSLLPFITWLVLFTELLGPFLAFLPFFTATIRTLVAFTFMLMHFLFGLSLEIGLFSYICMIAWIPFLPSPFWDKVLAKSSQWKNLTARFNIWLRDKLRLKPCPLVLKYSFLENVLVSFILAYAIVYNVVVVETRWGRLLPRQFFQLGAFLHLEQSWGMFAAPLKEDGWFVIPAKLLSGREVDIFSGGKEVSWEQPPLVSATFKDTRWIKYMQYLWLKSYAGYRLYYGQYLCRTWNNTHEGFEKINTFQIYYMLTTTQSDHKDSPKKILLWTHYCFAPETDKPLY